MEETIKQNTLVGAKESHCAFNGIDSMERGP